MRAGYTPDDPDRRPADHRRLDPAQQRRRLSRHDHAAEAFARSSNAAAVRLAERVGRDKSSAPRASLASNRR